MVEINSNSEHNNYCNSYGEMNIADLIRIYIKKWIILGIISIITAFAVFIIVNVFMNNGSKIWTAEFEFTYPGYELGMYPDGANFRYQDILSEDNIKKAISSNSAFVKYSTTEILRNNIVSISEKTEIKKIDNEENEIAVPGKYYFTVKSYYFKDATVTEDFLNALLLSAKEKVLESADVVYFQVYLDSYDSADTFQKKLDYLNMQKEYIISKYQLWINQYGEQFTVNGNALSRHLQNAMQAFTEKEYSSLSYELQNRQYVFYKADDEELICRFQIEILNDEYEDNNKKIQGLTEALENLRKTQNSSSTEIAGTQSNETYYYEQIAKLTERQVDIERKIKDIETQISNMSMVTEAKEYSQKLDVVRAKLMEQTTILENTIAPAVYADKTIAVLQLGGFKTSGTKSAVAIAVVAFIAMYLMVGFIIFILGNESKEKNVENLRKKINN